MSDDKRVPAFGDLVVRGHSAFEGQQRLLRVEITRGWVHLDLGRRSAPTRHSTQKCRLKNDRRGKEEVRLKIQYRDEIANQARSFPSSDTSSQEKIKVIWRPAPEWGNRTGEYKTGKNGIKMISHHHEATKNIAKTTEKMQKI